MSFPAQSDWEEIFLVPGSLDPPLALEGGGVAQTPLPQPKEGVIIPPMTKIFLKPNCWKIDDQCFPSTQRGTADHNLKHFMNLRVNLLVGFVLHP